MSAGTHDTFPARFPTIFVDYPLGQMRVGDKLWTNIVYVPINWSLQFYAQRYAKSHAIPDIVYVPTKWSL